MMAEATIARRISIFATPQPSDDPRMPSLAFNPTGSRILNAREEYVPRPATVAKQNAFLETYSKLGLVLESCREAGIAAPRHYEWLDKDPIYFGKFVEAHERSKERILKELKRRAIDGVERQIGWYKGESHGTEMEYSDALLALLAKAAYPADFRERYDITGKDGGPIQVSGNQPNFDLLEIDEKRELLRLLAKAGAITVDGGGDSAIDIGCKRVGEGSTGAGVVGVKLCAMPDEYESIEDDCVGDDLGRDEIEY